MAVGGTRVRIECRAQTRMAEHALYPIAETENHLKPHNRRTTERTDHRSQVPDRVPPATLPPGITAGQARWRKRVRIEHTQDVLHALQRS